MRVVGLNYLGVSPQWPLIVICVLAQAEARVDMLHSISRNTARKNQTTTGAMRRKGAKKAGVFMHMCFSGCADMFSSGRSV